MNTAAHWDSETSYVAGDYCSAIVGGFGVPPTWRYFKCLQDCTNIDVLDTDYWEEVVFASDVAERIAAYKQAMQDQYDAFLEDYQRQFGVVQTTGSSTTDVMSQKAVSDELATIDNTFNDIESGQEIVGHAAVADNLTPYSEDSGAIQDTPFISQGTGTGNNSVIVTTGDKAKQLEKLGTAVVYNMPLKNADFASTTSWNSIRSTLAVADNILTSTFTSSDTYTNFGAYQNISSGVIGHYYLIKAKVKYSSTNRPSSIGCATTIFTNITGNSLVSNPTADTWYDFIFIGQYNSGTMAMSLRLNYTSLSDMTVGDTVSITKPAVIDLTQRFNGNDNIPQDLLDNPSHFSWYYNGELTYNAGSIEHGEGVKLVCTRGRNLWNERTRNGYYDATTGEFISNANYTANETPIRVVPNTTLYQFVTGNTYMNRYTYFYDADMNFIERVNKSSNGTVIIPSNCQYINFFFASSYGATYKHDFTITPYYTPEQGGEGYDQYYPYEEPDIIDTGLEQLGAFDKKIPDGVITRATGTKTISSADVSEPSVSYDNVKVFAIAKPTDMLGRGEYVRVQFYNDKGWVYSSIPFDDTSNVGKYATSPSSNSIWFLFATGTTLAQAQAALDGMIIEYPLANSTTEQGTSFRQYAGINDYGIMYWLDENDNLVSIPQGCKIQYTVNYKGFIDDAYMYTNGDATAIALKDDITDAALASRGYLKLTALSGYDATKTQTLKNVQGVFTWVDDQ